MNTEQKQRYLDIETYFNKNNMELHEDSTLIKNYVISGQGKLEEILLAMQKARYLHEYCNFDLGRRIALNTVGGDHSHLSKENWLALVRKAVLCTTPSKHYPSHWPWEESAE